jgi:hypothetical protein
MINHVTGENLIRSNITTLGATSNTPLIGYNIRNKDADNKHKTFRSYTWRNKHTICTPDSHCKLIAATSY